MAMAWVDKSGGSSSKVKFVEVPFPQMEAALVGGKIDAISVHEPFATAALEKGQTRVLAYPWGDVLPKFLIASWVASEKWIVKNKEMGQAFVRAISRGVDSIHADPEGSRAAMLLINNQEVEKLLDMKSCLEALEDGYDDLLKGDAVYRPRLDVWMPCRRYKPGCHRPCSCLWFPASKAAQQTPPGWLEYRR